MVECDWETGVVSVLQDHEASADVTHVLDRLEKAAGGAGSCERVQRTLQRLKESKQDATVSLLEATSMFDDIEDDSMELSEEPPQEQEQGTCVTFRSQLELAFGQSLKVVGSSVQLGSWDSRVSVPLQWQDNHIWVAETVLDAGKHNFKLIISNENGATIWEGGEANRQLEVKPRDRFDMKERTKDMRTYDNGLWQSGVPVGAAGLVVDCGFGDTGNTIVSKYESNDNVSAPSA
eukprot:scaffold238838_cov38-Prasinocladus_malaysianus.AAC.1